MNAANERMWGNLEGTGHTWGMGKCFNCHKTVYFQVNAVWLNQALRSLVGPQGRVQWCLNKQDKAEFTGTNSATLVTTLQDPLFKTTSGCKAEEK